MSTERTVKAFMSDPSRPLARVKAGYDSRGPGQPADYAMQALAEQEARRILGETEPDIGLQTGHAAVTNQYMRNYWSGNTHPYSALADSLCAIMPELDRLAGNSYQEDWPDRHWEITARNMATLAAMEEK